MPSEGVGDNGGSTTTGQPEVTSSGMLPSSTSGAAATDDPPDPQPDVGVTTSAEATSSTTGGDGSSSTGNPDVEPLCKDGISVPGELCLEAEYDYPVIDNPTSVAVGDINDDGRVDIVIGSDNQPTVSVLLGQPDHSFGLPGEFETDPAGASDFVFLTHIDGDMLPDLLVVDATNRRLLAHLNVAGVLASPVITTYAPTPTQATMGDLDGDGRVDLVMVVNASTVIPFGNTGNGTFVEGEAITVDAGPVDVAVEDLDGNGWLDVLTANDSGQTVSLLYNQAGVLTPDKDPIAGAQNTRAVATGDFNEDGNPDVIHCNWGIDTLSLSLALAGGGFAATPVTIEVNDRPQRVLVEDFDLDGHLDIAVAQQGNADRVSIHIGTGGGAFVDPVTLALDNIPTDLATGDFNDDGVPDLVVVLAATDNAIVFLSDP